MEVCKRIGFSKMVSETTSMLQKVRKLQNYLIELKVYSSSFQVILIKIKKYIDFGQLRETFSYGKSEFWLEMI